MNQASATGAGEHAQLRVALAGQYRAARAMLGAAVRRCPDELWTRGTPDNAFWQLAYHTLFYTHLYLSPDAACFRPWRGHRGGAQNADALGPPEAPESGFPWYPMAKLEHQLVHLRHLQHHVGQLNDRLRAELGEGVDWVGSREARG